jgi:hypothetical protein
VHFAAAEDMQALAEAEYQRSAVELNLLSRFADGSRSAASAQGHFAAAGDAIGEARAAVLRSLNDFNIAAGMGPDVPRSDQRSLLEAAVHRVQLARTLFEANELPTDAMAAWYASCMREQVLGTYERAAPVYRDIRARPGARRQALRSSRHPQSRAYRRTPGEHRAVGRHARQAAAARRARP